MAFSSINLYITISLRWLSGGKVSALSWIPLVKSEAVDNALDVLSEALSIVEDSSTGCIGWTNAVSLAASSETILPWLPL